MSERRSRDEPVDDYPIPASGVGGQVVTPSDNSLFGTDPEPAPDSRGVNEDDVGTEDAGLVDPGASPEFDHSLRRRSPDPS